MQATIGQRIRQKRKELKLTQQDLARKMKDVSHVAISQWESNTTKPNAENLYENGTKQYFTARPIQISSWENLQKTVKFIILS